MADFDEQTRKPAFKQFSPEEIDVIKASAAARNLNPGDVLMRSGEDRGEIYVILNGVIKIISGREGQRKSVTTFGKGDWIGEIHFPRDIKNTSFAIASEASKVILVDRDIINRLDATTQLVFYKQLDHLSAQRFKNFDRILIHVEQKNKRLMEDIFFQRSGIKTDFRRMEMIRNITSKVPRLPAFASTMANKILDDKISAGDVAEEIMKDPSLVGVVLKTINSAYYGFEKKISDMRYAITLLGLDMIYQLVIAEGIKRSMPNTPAFKEVHTRSVIISQLAFTLSKESQIGDPAEMATIGLLHDVGQIVIHLLKEKNPNFDMYINMLDKSQMGALLLKTWNLPDIIWQSIEYQFYPEFSVPEKIPVDVRNNVTILYLTYLCYETFRGQSSDKLPVTFLEEYLQLMNWSEFSLKDIAREKLLPPLMKKINTFPTPVKQLVKRFAQSSESDG